MNHKIFNLLNIDSNLVALNVCVCGCVCGCECGCVCGCVDVCVRGGGGWVGVRGVGVGVGVGGWMCMDGVEMGVGVHVRISYTRAKPVAISI